VDLLTFLLQSTHTYNKYSAIVVRFEVFTAVTMKKAVFWDVAPCRSGVNRRFGGTRCHIPEDCFLLSAIVDLRNFKSIVAHALGFSVFTSRILVKGKVVHMLT
jgi:hypothetical protein